MGTSQNYLTVTDHKHILFHKLPLESYQKHTIIEDYEIDLLVQHNETFPLSTVISPRVCLLQPRNGHLEGSISPADLHTVSPPPCNLQALPRSMNDRVFSGADLFAEVQVEVFRAVACVPVTRAVDGNLSSNMATHLHHH